MAFLDYVKKLATLNAIRGQEIGEIYFVILEDMQAYSSDD